MALNNLVEAEDLRLAHGSNLSSLNAPPSRATGQLKPHNLSTPTLMQELLLYKAFLLEIPAILELNNLVENCSLRSYEELCTSRDLSLSPAGANRHMLVTKVLAAILHDTRNRTTTPSCSVQHRLDSSPSCLNAVKSYKNRKMAMEETSKVMKRWKKPRSLGKSMNRQRRKRERKYAAEGKLERKL